MKLPIPEFSAAIRPRLEALDLRKRAGDFFTFDVGPNLVGLIGLGRSTQHGELGIWPTCGIRHQPTERTVSELLGLEPHPYAPATIQSMLGYLMAPPAPTTWYIQDETLVDVSASEIAGAVEAFGIPAIRAFGSLTAIHEALTTKRAMQSVRGDYLLPVVLVELGMKHEAAAEIDRQLAARAMRGDHPEADQYRSFAAAFARWCGE